MRIVCFKCGENFEFKPDSVGLDIVRCPECGYYEFIEFKEYDIIKG